MSSAPAFAAAVNNNAALLTTAETSLTAPTTTATVWTAGASGGKIEEIIIEAIGTTVAGLVYVFLHDGTNYRLFDTFQIAANTWTLGGAIAPYRVNKTYDNLMMKTGWTLRISQNIAGNASLLVAHVIGGDF
jgi:hypothetical protein